MTPNIEDIKTNWKTYLKNILIYFGILVVGIFIGLTITGLETLRQILINTLSNIISFAPWWIILYIGFSLIAKSIKNLTKNIPNYIEQFYRLREHQRKIDWARGSKI